MTCLISGRSMRVLMLSAMLAGANFFANINALAKPELFAMAPLLVTDPRLPNWLGEKEAWDRFMSDALKLKTLGVTAVTVDVWWGIVQRNGPTEFDWSYYDEVFRRLDAVQLRIIPVLSVHACGGNVGDDIDIPLPLWLREKLPHLANGKDARYISEARNISEEVISVWATPYALDYYRNFWAGFKHHFAKYAEKMPLLIVGVGPSGELIHPSFHAHDRNHGYLPAYFPNRGSVQAASELAQERFRAWLNVRYPSPPKLNIVWSTEYKNFGEIRLFQSPEDADAFFHQFRQYEPIGHDFFDWYRDSLFSHGHTMALNFAEIFNMPDSPFQQSAIGLKIPGIYWSFTERVPELAAGLLSTRGSSTDGSLSSFQRKPYDWILNTEMGYRPLFAQVFEQLRKNRPEVNWVGLYTAGELENEARNATAGFTLTAAVGTLADHFKIPFYLENALAHNLFIQSSFDVFHQHLRRFKYFVGVTFLRMNEVSQSPLIRPFVHAIADIPSLDDSCGQILRGRKAEGPER